MKNVLMKLEVLVKVEDDVNPTDLLVDSVYFQRRKVSMCRKH